MWIKVKLIISLIVCSVSFNTLFLQRYLSGDIDQATHNKMFIFGPTP